MRRRHWIVSAVVILLVIYAARKVDWPAAGSILSHAALAPLAAAIAVNVLSLALRGVGWWIFLRRIGVNSLALAIRGEIVGAAEGRGGGLLQPVPAALRQERGSDRRRGAGTGT